MSTKRSTVILLVSAVLAFSTGGAQPGPAGPEPLSPRLRQVSSSGGTKAVVGRFWSEIARSGTPLIESIPGDSALLTTFLWRSEQEARVVVLIDFGDAIPRMTLQRLGATDIWYRSYRMARDARFVYELSVNDPGYPFVATDTTLSPAQTIPDPLNPKRWDYAAPRILSLAELPQAPTLQWTVVDSTRPRGSLGRFGARITSAILGNERSVWVYRPAGYSPTGREYPLLVFPASYMREVPLPTILDNMIAADRIPAVVAIFTDFPPGRQDTELGCLGAYSDFLANELVPWVRQRVNVTADPARIVVGGASAGGLAATCAAIHHPEVFGSALAQSGAFWRGRGGTAGDWGGDRANDSEREFVARFLASSPHLPVQFFLSIGTLESSSAWGGGVISMVHATRHLRDVLTAKGYALSYDEVAGGHDPYNWAQTLPRGLEALLAKAR